MVREGRGRRVQGGGRLADFSSARMAKVSTEGRTLRYEIGHKKIHKGKRGIEQPVNPKIDSKRNQ
jgi:hypothetical protein